MKKLKWTIEVTYNPQQIEDLMDEVLNIRQERTVENLQDALHDYCAGEILDNYACEREDWKFEVIEDKMES